MKLVEIGGNQIEEIQNSLLPEISPLRMIGRSKQLASKEIPILNHIKNIVLISISFEPIVVRLSSEG